MIKCHSFLATFNSLQVVVYSQAFIYAPAMGSIAESDGFRWDYLAGSTLKSQLVYPNEAVVTWTYEPHRDLLTAVTNATYSTYVYTNDLLGRRTSKNDEQYSYNVRDELISADEVSYNYDDIGNRTTAEGKAYTANNLNQYTAIDDFAPQYDADGNQTLIKTETGIWSVIYNAENRPIRWQSGDTIITMSFDRMGRRVEMRTQSAASDTLQRFVYDNYLCVQQLRGADNALFHSYVWDPTEPIATRPLVFQPTSGEIAYYFHDGNKNVSDLIPSSGTPIHYDYTPFGSATLSTSSANPFRFSSEVYDDIIGLICYNFRHYASIDARWMVRDPFGGFSLFGFCSNNSLCFYDFLGLTEIFYSSDVLAAITYLTDNAKAVTGENALALPEPKGKVVSEEIKEVCDEDCHPKGVRYVATVTIKATTDVAPAAVSLPKWGNPSTSEVERELFRQVYKLVLEHEQEHVRIWNKYMDNLLVEYVGVYESCADNGIINRAKDNAEEKMGKAYRELAEQFTKENNDFQKRDETMGRHKRVEALIEDYKRKRNEQ